MLEVIQVLGPIIVGLAGLFLGFIYNRRSLTQKQHEDERKEIYKKLNSFYGPLRQLRGISSELYSRFTANRSGDFRTLIALLEGQTFAGNDKILIEQILEVSEKIDDLILKNSGLVDDPELSRLLYRASTHFRILRLAYHGNLVGEVERFKDHVFPRDLDQKVEEQIQQLKRRLDVLNSM